MLGFVDFGGRRQLRRDVVDLLLADLAIVRDVRVMGTAQLVVTVLETPDAMAAADVAFEVFVGADHERDQGDRACDFDPAVGDDLRLAPERQREQHAAAGMCRLGISISATI
jgi:hypothetical protein